MDSHHSNVRQRQESESTAIPATPPARFAAQLAQEAGVVPGPGWLQEAWSQAYAVTSSTGEQGSTRASASEAAARSLEEAVFAQLLHHDLRCVVDRSNPSEASLTLRRALESSATTTTTTPAPAPSNNNSAARIRLMVQVEDATNVAQGLEARLGRSGEGSSAALLSSSSSSCWKLQLIDGYSPAPGPVSANATTGSNPPSLDFMVAMVVTPISNLTHRGQGMVIAGTKLLLELDLSRHVQRKVLLLTPDNCLVLGGQVATLVHAQQQHRQHAQQQAGVGVDPTVRALLSHNMILEDEPPDEGEGESGDVAPPPPQVPAPVAAVRTLPPPALSLATIQARTNRPGPVPAHLPAPAPNLTTVAPASAAAPSRAANPYGSQPTGSRPRAPASTSSNQSALSEFLLGTPYSSAPSPANPLDTSVEEVPPPSPPRMLPPPHLPRSIVASQLSSSSLTSSRTSNPYSSAVVAVSRSRSHSPQPFQFVASTASTTNGGSTLGNASTLPHHHHPNPLTTPTPVPETPAISSSNGARSGVYPTAANANAVAPTPPPSVTTVVSQRLDFDALHDLISRACSHRPLYERLYSQVFVSSLRQVVPKLHFNIEKVPREQRTPGTLQKHEYVLIARFRGAGYTAASTIPDPTITCKLSSRVMEPFFVESPDDMRQLKKTNRPRVDELIRDGGKQLQEYTSAVQSYTARLLAPPDEFFSSSKQGGGADAVTLNDPASILNGTKPIMYLDMVDDRAF